MKEKEKCSKSGDSNAGEMSDLEATLDFVGADTNVAPDSDLKTPVVKNKKLGLKMVSSKKGESTKKKKDLNISRLKSVATPKNFSFMNMSAQKLTLRSNNRSLAQKLAKTQQDLRQVTYELKDRTVELQEVKVELNHYKRVAGLKEENLEKEVAWRVQSLMNEMKLDIEELTQKMMEKTVIINNMHNKCLKYTRRSLNGSRGDSLGTDSVSSKEENQSGERQRSKQRRNDLETKVIKSATSMMVPSLPRSDERMAPSQPPVRSHVADMSLIHEQSTVGEEEQEEAEGFLYTAQRLSAVSESTGDTPEAPVKEPISRLPQRVRRSLDSKPPSGSGIKNMPSEVSQPPRSSVGKTLPSEVSQPLRSSIGKTLPSEVSVKETKAIPKTRPKDKSVNSSETRIKADNMNKDTSLLPKQDATKDKKADIDLQLDCDISSFGFGGNFADELISGSPISSPKVKESDKRKKVVETIKPVPPKIVVSEAVSNKLSEKKPVNKTKVKNNVTNSNLSLNKSSKLATKPSVKSSTNIKSTLKTEKVAKQSVVKPNQLRTKSVAKHPVSVKPVKSPVQEINPSQVQNPFKPTKVLLRSPVNSRPGSSAVTPEGPSPSAVLDSRTFIAMLTERTSKISQPLPDATMTEEPTFPEEPTCYFNADMELTKVVDVSKLTLPLSTNASRSSPVVVLEDVKESLNNETQRAKRTKGKKVVQEDEKDGGDGGGKQRHRSGRREKESEKLDSNPAEEDEAAVEVRNKKPGVFTFSVPRKDKDGTRKMEKISTARSKKKAVPATTPEKDAHRTGIDRDMFNFGDRTPTMPLEQLAKTKTVYDLSMNESVFAPTTSLNNLREKMKDKTVSQVSQSRDSQATDTKSNKDEHVYYMPLKGGSPDEKPATKSRSKSTTRSRSKSRSRKEELDDENWTPTARSKSRAARSKSRTRRKEGESDDVDEDASDKAGKARSKSRPRSVSRSRSRSRKTVAMSDEEDEIPMRRGRSKARVDDDDDDVEEDLMVRASRARSKKRTVVPDEARETTEADVESNEVDKACEVNGKGVDDVRRSRARSKARTEVTDSKETVVAGDMSEGRSISDDGRRNGKGENVADVESSARSKSRMATLTEGAPKLSQSENKKNSKMQSDVPELGVYHIPLKGSPDQMKPKRETRSRSRSRARLDDGDGEVIGRSRSRSRARKVQLEDVAASAKVAERPRRKSTMSHVATETEESGDGDADQRELDTHEKPDFKNSKERKSSVRNVMVEDTDSDFEDEFTVLKSRRMSRKRVRSSRVDVLSADESLGECGNARETLSVSKVTKVNKSPDRVEVVIDSNDEDEGNEVSAVFNFVTKSRRRNVRPSALKVVESDTETDTEQKLKDEGKDKNLGDIDTLGDENDHENVKNVKNKSLKTPVISCEKSARKTKSGKTASKSVRKSKKQVSDVELETPRPSTDAKSIRKPLEDEDVNQSEESRSQLKSRLSKPTKTPAGTKSVRASKNKTGSKSSRKQTEVDPLDPMPRGKGPQKSMKKSRNKENATQEDNLAKMKRKLNLMSMRASEPLSQSSPTKKNRLSEQAVDLETEEEEAEERPDDRTRRRKQPVSYAPLKLNVKLRREDVPTSAESMTKAKAEIARVSLASKTALSLDDL